jgi:hypothetical protein
LQFYFRKKKTEIDKELRERNFFAPPALKVPKTHPRKKKKQH